MERATEVSKTAKSTNGLSAASAEKASVNLDVVNPRSEWGLHMAYTHRNRADHVRHWTKPRPNGDIRTMADQFVELTREAKASLYVVLYDLVHGVYCNPKTLFKWDWFHGTNPRWAPMATEERGLVDAACALEGRDRRQGSPYGETYERVRLGSNSVLEAYAFTKSEAEEHNAHEHEMAAKMNGYPTHYVREGDIVTRTSPQQAPQERQERIAQYWVNVFLHETRILLDESPNQERAIDCQGMLQTLTDFKVGSGEGAQVLEMLRSESGGAEILAAYERIRSGLLSGIEALLKAPRVFSSEGLEQPGYELLQIGDNPSSTKMDAVETMRLVMDGIRADRGLPSLPEKIPAVHSLWMGRSKSGAFDQMRHEAHYCLLTLLLDGAAEVERYRKRLSQTMKGYRPPLEAERPQDDGYINKLGNQRRELAAQWYHSGGSPQYGLTLAHQGTKAGTLAQRWEHWIEVFASEVEHAFNAHNQNGRAAKEVERLASGIAHLRIGEAERIAYEERLELATTDWSNKGQYAAPGDIAAMFQGHIESFNAWRDRLLERLKVVGVGNDPAMPKMSVLQVSGEALTIPEVARLCWCMKRAGHSDHTIVNATAAIRLAKRYGHLHERAGERLKQEWDRFDGPDGIPYLKGGQRSREAYGRKAWAAVKDELERLGYSDAVAHAEAILSDL